MTQKAVEGSAAATSPGGSKGVIPGIKRCIDCRHYRLRAKPVLFSGDELQTAGGLKSQMDWEQQEKQHLAREEQMVAGNKAFTYEPHHYAWCAAYTQLDDVKKAAEGDEAALAALIQHGGASMNPVTGEVTPIYALCLRMNPTGSCEKHERL